MNQAGISQARPLILLDPEDEVGLVLDTEAGQAERHRDVVGVSGILIKTILR